MRLFVALCFQESFCTGAMELMKELREGASSGNFTRRENLHLTLAFLGEQSSASLWLSALEKLDCREFSLQFDRLGSFSGTGGELFWLGARRQPLLDELLSQLLAGLEERGFEPEKRPFRPHVTLGREVILPEVKQAEIQRKLRENPLPAALAERVSLMRSQRVAGRLIYTEVGGISLKKSSVYRYFK